MGQPYGANLGGVRTLDDLMARCYVDPDTHCWHWRGAMQKRGNGTEEPRVWLADDRKTATVSRAAWKLAGKRALRKGETVWRRCLCDCCGNPAHMMAGTKAQWGAWVSEKGYLQGRPERAAINRRTKIESGQAKLTPELAQWANESPQLGVDVAWALGVSATTVSRARLRQTWAPVVPVASIFGLAMQLQAENQPRWRRRA